MTDPIRILYVDDYPLDRALVRDALGSSSQDFELLEASTEKEFVELMEQGNFDLVLTDFNILGFTGLQVLERIQSTYPEIPVIMVTGTGSEEIAAEAIKRGAADYVIKTPHYIQRLPHTIQNALANQVLQQQRRDALEQLRENEQRYRDLVENINEGIWGIDEKASTTFVNPAMAEILGYTVEEMLGKHLFDFMDKEQVETAKKNLKREEGGESGQYEFIFLHKDGSEVSTLINTQPLIDEQGNYQGALAAVQDISERQAAQQIIRQNQRQLTSLMHNVPGSLWSMDADYRFLYGNDRFRNDIQKAFGEKIQPGKDLLQHISPQEREEWKGFYDRALAGESFRIERRRKYGNTGSWNEYFFNPIPGEDGTPSGVMVIAYDITDRKNAAQFLHESEKKYRSLVDNLGAALFLHDKDARIVDVNQASLDRYGYSREELLEMEIHQIDSEIEERGDRELYWQNLDREAPQRFEARHRTRDGKTFPVEISLAPVTLAGEEHIIALALDISDRKLATRELEQAHETLTTVLESIDAHIYVSDFESYEILYMNQKMKADFGQELIGKLCYQEFRGEEQPCSNCQLDDLIDQHGNPAAERTWEGFNPKTERWYLNTDRAIYWTDQRLAHIQIALDIHDRKLAEQELQESQAFLSAIYNQSLNAIMVADDQGNYLEVNQAAADLFGYSIEELQSMNVGDLRTNSDPDAARRFQEYLKTGQEIGEFDFIHSSGQPRVALYHAVRIGENLHLSMLTDISQRKVVERELDQINHQLILAQEIARIGNWTLDPEAGVPIWSDEVYKIYERDPELGPYPLADYSEIYQGAHWDRFNQAIQAAIQHGAPYDIELLLELGSGETKWIRAICQPDPEPGPAGHFLQGTIQDITDRKLAEERERQIFKRLQLALESAREGFWEYDAKSGEVHFDELGYAMLGYKPDFPAQDLEWWVDQIHPDHRSGVDEAFNRFLAGKDQNYYQEFQLKNREGNYLWVASNAQVIEHDKTGKPLSIVGLHQDIDERKTTEIALQDSESRYRNLVESSPDGIITISKNGRVMSINRKFYQLTGYSEGEILNKHFLQVPTLLPQDLEFYKKIVPQILQGKIMDPIEFRWKHASGEIRDGEARTSPLRVEREVIGLLGIVRDITERKKAEQKIHESEQRYRQLYQTAGMGVGYWTTDGKVISFNEIALNHMQMTKEQVAGKHLTDIFPEELAAVYMKRIQAVIEADEPLEFEDQIALPSGPAWFLSVYSTVKDLNDQIQGVQISSLNITDRKTAEQQLQEREAVLNRSQEIARVGSYIWDLRDDSLTWSDTMYAIHGLDPDQFSGNLTKTSQQVIHPEDREQVAAEIEQMVQNRKVHSMQFRVLLPNGTERVMRSSGEFELDESGQPIRAIGVHQDITEEIKAQQEILESRELLVRLSRAAHSVQNILDPEVIIETIGQEISSLGFNTTILELNESQTRLHIRYNSFSSQLVSKMIKLLGIKPENFSFDVKPGGYFDSILQNGTTSLKPVESQPFQEVFPGIPHPIIKQIRNLFNYEFTILAPLMDQDQPLGLLTVLGSELTEEDLTPIDIFANQASTALRNARYAAALKERAEELVLLTTTLEETEEAERTRMAQELHDQVGQSLALLGFNLNMIKSQLKDADIKDLEKIYDAQILLEEISSGIRSVMDDLRPSILDDYGLLAALHWLSDKYSERTRIEVDVIGTASESRLDRRVENSLFRITQEGLTNVARHAEADQVKIELIPTPKWIKLILEDNGKGFNTEQDPGDREQHGWGLINMKERAKRIGGELTLESDIGQGTRISIQVPRE